MAFKKATEPAKIEETFSVTLDSGQKGEADTYDEAIEVGRKLLDDNPKATFFAIAKKYKRGG